VLVAIASLVVAAILSFVFKTEFLIIDTTKTHVAHSDFGYVLFLILGCSLILFQFKALLYVLFPRSLWKQLPFTDLFLMTGTAKAERCTKQAAAFKTNKMIENALFHHESGIFGDSTRTKSITPGRVAYGSALLHFDATSDLRAKGGIVATCR
jgi:hypothetical protein